MKDPSSRLRLWQGVTLVFLVFGYAGYYLCRSNLSVAMPLLIDEAAHHGLDPDTAKIRFGAIVSMGVLAYALGKFFSGGIADFIGGRRNFLAGMIGSVVFTVLCTLGGGLPLFTIASIGNRLVQSMGWVGMVKVSSRWFSYTSYGAMMGVLSLSYLFGDAASRQFMAALIHAGMGWRGVYQVAAGVLFVLFLLNFFFLKETPRLLGLEEPPTSPETLFGEEGELTRPPSFFSLLQPLLSSPAFWLICLLSLGFTLIRETFNTWTPTYLTQAVGLLPDDAASKSALFPLLGGFSVLFAGFLGDRLGRGGRSLIILIGLLLTAAFLLLLGFGNFNGSKMLPVLLISATAFTLIGPYSYLAGAISLDFGGKQGCSTACGIIDGVGYLGGVLAGDAMAQISVTYGWRGAFAVLAGVAGLSSLAAFAYVVSRFRSPLPQSALEMP